MSAMNKREKHIGQTDAHNDLMGGLSVGSRDMPASGKCVFFDYLKAVVAYEEFGPGRERRIAELEEAEKNDFYKSVQLHLPWVTDAFIYGILAGEEAQNDAKRALLARYATFPETAAEADHALTLDRMRMATETLGAQSGGAGDALPRIRSMLGGGEWTDSAERLSEVRWCLKYLPQSERAKSLDMVLGTLLAGKGDWKWHGAETFSQFAGRYSAVPVALKMDAAYAGLSKIPLAGTELREYFVRNKCAWFDASDTYQAVLTRGVERCSRIALTDKAQEWRLKSDVETVCRSNDVQNILALRDVADETKERIANGIVGVELLWALSRQSASRMNARGSGAIPAFNLAGRIMRDGRAIDASREALYSVDEALDTMVMRAMCQFQAGRTVDGVNISTYEPFREYMEGEFNGKHLTALIDNAIANKRCAIVRPRGGAFVSTISIDAPVDGDDDGEGGSALIDMLPGGGGNPPDDYSRFVFAVAKRHAPTMWRYLRLVTWGISASDIERLREGGMSSLVDKYTPGEVVSKGDALKMVGAKTPHLVERERAALLKALEGVKGRDYQEMAARLKKTLEK